MFALGLALKISFAGVGYEERSNGPVAIVGAKISMAAVESAELAIGPARFKDRSPDGSISQLLRETQILCFADRAKFVSVFLVMFVEFFLAAEAWAGSEQQQPKQQESNDFGYATGHQTIRSFCSRYFAATTSSDSC
jgi:hypothetical protein